MSCFDTVVALCPVCKGPVNFQSKADKCDLKNYDINCVPVKIALDIQGELGTCGNCDREYTIHPMVHVATMPMYLTPHTEEYSQVNHEDHWSAAGKTVPPKPKTWDLWIEGYQATGGSGTARCYARNLPGDSFKDAVTKFAATPQAKGLGLFDEERLSFWGCRAFDNEEDARRNHG